MADRFPECLRLTDILEGNDSNDKNDKGGFTRGGAIQSDCDEYADLKKIPRFSIHTLTPAMRADIFRTLYFDCGRFDLLPAPLDFITYQYAVNRYPAAAVKQLQLALGVAFADGVLSAGGATLGKVRLTGTRISCGLLLTAQAHNYESIVRHSNDKLKAWAAEGRQEPAPADQREFARGWLDRCEKAAELAQLAWTLPAGLREAMEKQHNDFKAGIYPA